MEITPPCHTRSPRTQIWQESDINTQCHGNKIHKQPIKWKHNMLRIWLAGKRCRLQHTNSSNDQSANCRNPRAHLNEWKREQAQEALITPQAGYSHFPLTCTVKSDARAAGFEHRVANSTQELLIGFKMMMGKLAHTSEWEKAYVGSTHCGLLRADRPRSHSCWGIFGFQTWGASSRAMNKNAKTNGFGLDSCMVGYNKPTMYWLVKVVIGFVTS